VFHTKLAINTVDARKVIKSCRVPHNLHVQDAISECDMSAVDEGNDSSPSGMLDLHSVGNRPSQLAVELRNKYCDYFNVSAPLSCIIGKQTE
jgi:hypothetical protein